MKSRQRKSACTAATVASAKHSEYAYYYNRNAAKRQAEKNRRSNGVNMALALVGLLLLVATSGADEAGLLSGKAMAFVMGVALLAMWTGGGRNHAA